MELVFLVHAGATLALCGLIWTIQTVHYPLFARVGQAAFPDYEREHQARITRVVAPLMTMELCTAVALVIWVPPSVPTWAVLLGLSLVLWIWTSTAVLAVPHHRALEQGFDEQALAGLVRTNWQRTIAWSMRSVLVLWMIAKGAANT